MPEFTISKIKALVGSEKDPVAKAKIVYKYVQEKVRQNPNANFGQALQWIEEAQLLIYRKQLEGEHRVLEVQKRNTQ